MVVQITPWFSSLVNLSLSLTHFSSLVASVDLSESSLFNLSHTGSNLHPGSTHSIAQSIWWFIFLIGLYRKMSYCNKKKIFFLLLHIDTTKLWNEILTILLKNCFAEKKVERLWIFHYFLDQCLIFYCRIDYHLSTADL